MPLRGLAHARSKPPQAITDETDALAWYHRGLAHAGIPFTACGQHEPGDDRYLYVGDYERPRGRRAFRRNLHPTVTERPLVRSRGANAHLFHESGPPEGR